MSAGALLRPIDLVLDWDVALTVLDTKPLLAYIAMRRDIRNSTAPDKSMGNWNELLNSTAHEHRAFRSNSVMPGYTMHEGEYREWLSSFKPVAIRGMERICISQFFKGATLEDVKSAAEETVRQGWLLMRPGWLQLLSLFAVDQTITVRNSSVTIISTSYSALFIRWCLYYEAIQDAGNLGHHAHPYILQLINNMRILANEINGLAYPLGGTGHNEAIIASADDKETYMPASSAVSKMAGAQGNSSNPLRNDSIVPNAKPWVVYIGGGEIDFKGLKAADSGIWLHNVPKHEHGTAFLDTFRPLRIAGNRDNHPTPIYDVGPKDPDRGKILWAQNLDQVALLLTRIGPLFGALRMQQGMQMPIPVLQPFS